MTDTQRAALKEKIQAELKRIEADIAALEEITRPDTEDEDEATRMNNIVSKSVNDTALAAARTRFAGLEYALQRINGPEFGFCIDCGEEIPQARLLAMPETARCVHCAR